MVVLLEGFPLSTEQRWCSVESDNQVFGQRGDLSTPLASMKTPVVSKATVLIGNFNGPEMYLDPSLDLYIITIFMFMLYIWFLFLINVKKI